MQTIPAQRINAYNGDPFGTVNITFEFRKAAEKVFLNIDGGQSPQHFAISFANFEKVTTAWADGDDDTTEEDIDNLPPIVRVICEMHGDGVITSEEKARLLAAL